MNAVNGLRCNVNGTLKTESNIRSVNIIINGLRKMDDIQPFLPKQIGSLLGSVAAQNHQTVKIQLVVGLLHSLHLIQAVLIRHTHQLKGLTGGA